MIAAFRRRPCAIRLSPKGNTDLKTAAAPQKRTGYFRWIVTELSYGLSPRGAAPRLCDAFMKFPRNPCAAITGVAKRNRRVNVRCTLMLGV